MAEAGRARLDSIDLLRGLVMVVMALDHVREYFQDVRFSPTDLAATTPAYFWTRWVTHFAAPVFVLLAGTSAFLSGERRSNAHLSHFLLTRGLWLIVLELTVVTFAWTFDVRFPELIAQVIWAIGWSMVALAGLVWLPVPAVGAIGVAILALHNLADPLRPEQLGALSFAWTILHERGPLYPAGQLLFADYPILPWIGVIAAGYALGPVLKLEPARRRVVLLALGGGMVVAFVALRLLNAYGDPAPWSTQATPRFTFLSFMNVTKYPPSLLFVLVTLGPMLALLAILDRAKGAIATFFTTLGRVPLFYYVTHIYLIHALVLVFALLEGLPPTSFLSHPFVPSWPADHGWGLPLVYAVWIGIVLALYPACAWFARVKATRREWWLSYL